MHGLAGHGPTDALPTLDAAPTSAHAIWPDTPTAVPNAGSAVAQGGMGAALAHMTSGAPSHSDGMPGVAGLCLAALCHAVLAVGVLALIRFHATHGGGLVLSRNQFRSQVGSVHRRDADPPSLTRLSIRRC